MVVVEDVADGHGDGDRGDEDGDIRLIGDDIVFCFLNGDRLRVLTFRGLMVLQTEHRILSISLSRVHREHCH